MGKGKDLKSQKKVLEKGGEMILVRCRRMPALTPGTSKQQFWQGVRRRLGRILRGEEESTQEQREWKKCVALWLREKEEELVRVEAALAALGVNREDFYTFPS